MVLHPHCCPCMIVLTPRRKISCIGGYRHDISWRNIGPAIFHGEISFRWYLGINPEKLAISRNISTIFLDISHGQRGSTKVKRATVKSMCYNGATVPSPFASKGIWTPNLLVWGTLHLPSGQSCPCLILCTKLIYT